MLRRFLIFNTKRRGGGRRTSRSAERLACLSRVRRFGLGPLRGPLAPGAPLDGWRASRRPCGGAAVSRGCFFCQRLPAVASCCQLLRVGPPCQSPCLCPCLRPCLVRACVRVSVERPCLVRASPCQRPWGRLRRVPGRASRVGWRVPADLIPRARRVPLLRPSPRMPELSRRGLPGRWSM